MEQYPLRKLLSNSIILLLLVSTVQGQYAPGVGNATTTAVHQDSSVFKFWGSEAMIERGPLDISQPELGYPDVGGPEEAVGKANGLSVVSLGDGGTAVITFNGVIADGPGSDFAVFENSFNSTFLELAYVEVSSTGVDYYRFPSHSVTQDSIQVDPFGVVLSEKINNLAGKYEARYGTPFDLSELAGVGSLNVDSVSHIKIIDVIGSVDPQYGSMDTAGNFINDPWPTPFPSGGFDLDAVGVINGYGSTQLIAKPKSRLRVYPQPVRDVLYVEGLTDGEKVSAQVVDCSGQIQISEQIQSDKIDLSALSAGLYYLILFIDDQDQIQKFKVVVN